MRVGNNDRCSLRIMEAESFVHHDFGVISLLSRPSLLRLRLSFRRHCS